MRHTIRLLFILCLGFSSAIVLSEQTENISLSNLPQYYPDYFEHAAIFTGVDKKNGELLFGVLRMKFDQNIKVHLLTTEFGTIDQLQTEMPVAFSLHTGQFNNGLIKQIWQLPSGTIPAH